MGLADTSFSKSDGMKLRPRRIDLQGASCVPLRVTRGFLGGGGLYVIHLYDLYVLPLGVGQFWSPDRGCIADHWATDGFVSRKECLFILAPSVARDGLQHVVAFG